VRPRTFFLSLIVGLVLPARALAQDTPPPLPSPPPSEPAPQASDLLVPTPPEWKAKYDDARAKLLTGEFTESAAMFADLEKTAVNRTDRALANAQGTLAAAWATRGLAFVAQKDLGESNASAKALDKRTTDELVSLYTNGVFYGIGSGVWLGVLTQPKTAAAGVLPAIALTGASVGTIIALDSGRGFHYGVPQSIVSGMYIGLEEGIVWGVWAANKHEGGDFAKQEATIVWGATTVGAVTGGVLASAIGTTPGRASWVGSTTLWGGTLAAFTVGAFDHGNNVADDALLGAGIFGTVGIGVGIATAEVVSPSIARARFLDLGGLAGGLIAGGLYVAAANDKANGNAASGVTGLGAALGLGATWAITANMAEDRPHEPTKPEPVKDALSNMRPMLLPTAGGAMMGIGGSLD
jgi:hypothetical protein